MKSRFLKLALCTMSTIFIVIFSITYLNAQLKISKPFPSEIRRAISSNFRSPEIMRSIGKEIMVEGFYYAGSIPMIVDDIERTYSNIEMPPDSYMVLTGLRPTGIRSGDKISVTGIIRKPKAGDPKQILEETVIMQGMDIRKISASNINKNRTTNPLDRLKEHMGNLIPFPVTNKKVASSSPRDRLRERMSIPSAEKIEALGRGAMNPAKKFAVLIAGGGDYSNNHIRYWNDLLCMYQILRSSGYPAENIRVIYHDGFEPDDSVEGKVSGTMPIDFAANRGNIARVFNELAATVRNNDTLFIMINDHGGGLLTKKSGSYEPGLHNAQFDAYGETTEDLILEAEFKWDFNEDGDKTDSLRVDESFSLGPGRGRMYDDDFAVEVNKIKDYQTMIIVMEQCFSGGFIDDLRGPNRIIISAASPNQISRAQRPKDGGVAAYNEFTYWFFTVLMGRTPDGGKIIDPSGQEVNIDMDWDGNGRISMQEAFNWARRMHGTDDTPHYDDNNHAPCHTGYVPYSTTPGEEGFLGSQTFL